MNETTFIFLFFLLACALILGILAGGYFANRLHEKKVGQDKETRANEMVGLRKDPASGTLEVVIAGQTFHSVKEMNAVQRTLAGYAVNDLRTWLALPAAPDQVAPGPESAAAADATMTGAPVPDATAAAAPPDAPGAALARPAILEQPGVAPAEGAGAEDPKKRKRVGLLGSISRAFSSEVSTARIPPPSIAAQVNTILQKKLKGTPLESRGVSLMELPGQEMVVIIGPDQYDTVNAVPDDEIRGVIQAAVNEWLARSTT